ncbi:DNA-3-methyladenine glycosylase I, partial [Klebsiella pneumoniae]
PLYIQYHDTEWGVPERDNHKLFEMICLEGQQAGLSWLVILKKRENYRQAFFQFDPEKVAAMTDADVDKLMQNPGIVRQRAKINAIISN